MEKRRKTKKASEREEVSPFGTVIAVSILTETQVSALDPRMTVPLTRQAGRECPVKGRSIQQRWALARLHRHHYHQKEANPSIHVNSPHWTQACYKGHKPLSRPPLYRRTNMHTHAAFFCTQPSEIKTGSLAEGRWVWRGGDERGGWGLQARHSAAAKAHSAQRHIVRGIVSCAGCIC